MITDTASGADKARPGRRRALELCRHRKADVMVVWKLDRLSRSLNDLLTTAVELQALGVNLVSLHDQVDTTTPAGRALFQLVGVFAEFERGLIRERVRSGIAAARARGIRLGRPRIDETKLSEARLLIQKGCSLRHAAIEVGLSPASLSRHLRDKS